MRVLLFNYPFLMVTLCFWYGQGLLYGTSFGNIRTIAKVRHCAIALA
ncbi:MAG TPA: hypothetical protein VK203_02070 [Nostocaceae cyanobacterium]|nr:hypothetical protein [Nostocaceae cyanobacterium]